MSIKKNTLWNLFGSGSPMLIGFFAIPYILGGIGVELLGVLTLVWAIIGYFSIFDFGLGRALTQKLSSLMALKQENKCAAAAKSGLNLVAITGLAGSILLVALLFIFDIRWLKISDGVLDDVRLSLILAAVAIPITTITSGLKGILEGIQEFRIVNIYKFILGVANFASPIASIALYGPSLPAIVLSLVLSRLAVMILHLWSVGKKVPSLSAARPASNKKIHVSFWFSARG